MRAYVCVCVCACACVCVVLSHNPCSVQGLRRKLEEVFPESGFPFTGAGLRLLDQHATFLHINHFNDNVPPIRCLPGLESRAVALTFSDYIHTNSTWLKAAESSVTGDNC